MTKTKPTSFVATMATLAILGFLSNPIFATKFGPLKPALYYPDIEMFPFYTEREPSMALHSRSELQTVRGFQETPTAPLFDYDTPPRWDLPYKARSQTYSTHTGKSHIRPGERSPHHKKKKTKRAKPALERSSSGLKVRLRF